MNYSQFDLNTNKPIALKVTCVLACNILRVADELPGQIHNEFNIKCRNKTILILNVYRV